MVNTLQPLVVAEYRSLYDALSALPEPEWNRAHPIGFRRGLKPPVSRSDLAM
jgi:hypothetical protein